MGKKITYQYVAERDGQQYNGSLEAESRFEVYRHVRDEGGELVSLRKVDVFSPVWLQYVNEHFTRVKAEDKIIFARNLAAMLGAGLSLVRALATVERQTSNERMKYIARTLAADVRAGKNFHEALGAFPKIFPSIFVAMVHAGEESGNLPSTLKSLAIQLDKAYKLKKRIKSAMTYPVIVIFAMVLIGILMMVKVVPSLKGVFGEMGMELPASTRMMIGASDFMIQHSVMAVILAIGSIVGLVMLLRTKGGKHGFDWLSVRIPAIGTIVKEVNSARFSRTMSSLLGAGVDLIGALDITAEVVQNSLHKAVIREASEQVSKGQQMAEIFAKHEALFSPLVAEMLAVGEETGNVSELLGQVADFYEEEVDQKTGDMSTIIEPFLMLFIGAGVGFFAISMIAPIYSLSNAI